MIGKILDVVWYYEQNSHNGKPYWRDPLFISAVIAVLADIAVRFGFGIDNGLQSRIVDIIVALIGVFAIAKPNTGVKPKPVPRMETEHGGGG